MAKRNLAAENAKAALIRRLRRESIGVVYARTPGGEGRAVSEQQMVRFGDAMQRSIEREAIWLRWSVIASWAGLFLFGALATRYRIGAFALPALVSLVGWTIPFCWWRWQRWRLEQRFWESLERQPATPALARCEKVRRGYALAWWQWPCLLAFLAVILFIEAPGDIFPDQWRIPHALSRIALILLGGAILAGMGILHLFRRWR